jgi:CxxC-x17-CxxC domain-containing protein
MFRQNHRNSNAPPAGRGPRQPQDNFRGVRQNPQAPPPRPAPPQLWDATCTACQAATHVPFEPRPNSDVFCRSCLQERRERRELAQHFNNRDQKRAERGAEAPAIPRIDHGTRVLRSITCTACGRAETLTYSPRNIENVLCTECLQDKVGKESWREVRERAHAQAANPKGPPPRKRPLDVAIPDHTRLEGAEPVNKSVRVRHNKQPR